MAKVNAIVPKPVPVATHYELTLSAEEARHVMSILGRVSHSYFTRDESTKLNTDIYKSLYDTGLRHSHGPTLIERI